MGGGLWQICSGNDFRGYGYLERTERIERLRRGCFVFLRVEWQ